MAKIRQSFTREHIEYKLNEKTNTLVELPERTNMQELINSHYDETLYYNLERYFSDNVNVLPCDSDDEVLDEDINLTGCKADRMLNALERVQDLRHKYSIPDVYTDIEVLKYLRARAAEAAAPTEGGDNDGTQTQTTEQESEQA